MYIFLGTLFHRSSRLPVIFKVILFSLDKTPVLVSEKKHPALQNTLGKNRNITVSRMDPNDGLLAMNSTSPIRPKNHQPNQMPKKCCGHKNSHVGGFNPTHLKNMLVNLDHFPKHHPEILYPHRPHDRGQGSLETLGSPHNSVPPDRGLPWPSGFPGGLGWCQCRDPENLPWN